MMRLRCSCSATNEDADSSKFTESISGTFSARKEVENVVKTLIVRMYKIFLIIIFRGFLRKTKRESTTFMGEPKVLSHYFRFVFSTFLAITNTPPSPISKRLSSDANAQ